MRPRKVYDAALVERVIALYVERELSIVDVGTELAISRHLVERILIRENIPRRGVGSGAARRRNRNRNSYYACHQRVRRVRGSPQRCEVCKTRSTKKHYDWANMTGKLDDPFDYVRMCRTCHKRHDSGIKRVVTNHTLALHSA
jgi:hypothetical protein